METHTPTPAERFTLIRGKLRARLDAEGRRYSIDRVVDLLVLEILTFMIGLCISRAEQGAEQQPCRDGAGAEPGPAAAGDDGADRQGAARGPDARGRVAVSAAGGTPVIDGVTAVCERQPHERQNWAAMARIVPAVNYGSRVLEARFAKTELRTRVELCRFHCDIATLSRQAGRCPEPRQGPSPWTLCMGF